MGIYDTKREKAKKAGEGILKFMVGEREESKPSKYFRRKVKQWTKKTKRRRQRRRQKLRRLQRKDPLKVTEDDYSKIVFGSRRR